MTQQEFEGTLRSYGFREDSEYKGVWAHPDESGVTTYFASGLMAITFNMEYTIYRDITDSRLIALLDLYKK